jgi:hypothetical protein
VPHFHRVFSAPIDRSACDGQWAKIIGIDHAQPLTRLEQIRHWGKTINYLLKDKSKQVPQGFDPEKATTIARHLRKAYKKKRPLKRKYDGRFSQTFYDEGPSAAKNLSRLLDWYENTEGKK